MARVLRENREVERSGGESLPALRPHAAERWARAVVSIIQCGWDPRNLEGWARVAAIGRGTLRGWCRAARVPAKSSLDFARLLRAVLRSQGSAWDPQNILDVIDERTLKRLCARGGLSNVRVGAPSPTAGEFLARQQLVRQELALREVNRMIAADH